MHPFAALDDIGFIGIAAGRKLSDEDVAFLAQKGEEARQEYRKQLEAEGRNYEEERKMHMERRRNSSQTQAAPKVAYA